MANRQEKKIFLLIVEGGSDALALKGCINKLLNKRNMFSILECEVYSSDISLHPFQDGSSFSNPQDVISNLHEAIDNFIEEKRISDKLKPSDIAYVATLSDLDYCYCPDSKVLYSPKKDGIATIYDSERKVIFSNDLPFMRKRNENKCEALQILADINLISLSETINVPFKAFYFNRNLEHALYNDTKNHSQEEKSEMAYLFRRKYINSPEEFLSLIRSISRLSDTYEGSWDESLLKREPFDRLSNLYLFLEWILDLDSPKENSNGLTAKPPLQ